MDGLSGWLDWAAVLCTCEVNCIHVSSVAIASGKHLTGLACAHMQTGHTRVCTRVPDLFCLMHGRLCEPCTLMHAMGCLGFDLCLLATACPCLAWVGFY